MRDSILQDLYYGDIRPWEHKHTYDPVYAELTKKIIKMAEHFRELLSDEEYAKFEEMQNLRAEADMIESEDLFEYSFCLGAQLMTDIFTFPGND